MPGRAGEVDESSGDDSFARRFGILARELEAEIERNANRRAIHRRLRRPASRPAVRPLGLAGEPETVEAFAISQECAVACAPLSCRTAAFGARRRRASHFVEAGVQVPKRDFMPVDVCVQAFICSSNCASSLGRVSHCTSSTSTVEDFCSSSSPMQLQMWRKGRQSGMRGRMSKGNWTWDRTWA